MLLSASQRSAARVMGRRAVLNGMQGPATPHFTRLAAVKRGPPRHPPLLLTTANTTPAAHPTSTDTRLGGVHGTLKAWGQGGSASGGWHGWVRVGAGGRVCAGGCGCAGGWVGGDMGEAATMLRCTLVMQALACGARLRSTRGRAPAPRPAALRTSSPMIERGTLVRLPTSE